jgi:hypothetical protein
MASALSCAIAAGTATGEINRALVRAILNNESCDPIMVVTLQF